MARTINDQTYQLIRQYEGCKLRAYDDHNPSRELAANTPITGTLTIGIGHTGGVKWNDRITEGEAEQIFRRDVRETEEAVSRFITVPLNDNEFGALVSFTFNCGLGNLQKLAGTRLNKQNDRLATASAFALYNKSKGKVLRGLTARRAAEAALFLTPTTVTMSTQTPDDVKSKMSMPQISATSVATTAATVGPVAAGLDWRLAAVVVVGVLVGAFLFFKYFKR